MFYNVLELKDLVDNKENLLDKCLLLERGESSLSAIALKKHEVLNSHISVCDACALVYEGEIIEKKSKAGKIFYGCNKYPDCSFALWDEPTGTNCPECGELLVKKTTKNGVFESCSSRNCSYRKQIETVEATEQVE